MCSSDRRSYTHTPTRGLYVRRPEAGTRCGKSARRDLCGGCPERGIPTATAAMGRINMGGDPYICPWKFTEKASLRVIDPLLRSSIAPLSPPGGNNLKGQARASRGCSGRWTSCCNCKARLIGGAPGKAWKGGCHEDHIAETFRSDPVGNHSHPTKPGQQSEASLEWLYING